MKTPEKIYLSKDQEHGATWGEEKIRDDDARYIREDIHEKALEFISEESYTKGLLDARTYKEKAETFTKEQVIELMKETWMASKRNIHFFERSHLEYFDDWLEQKKPFDTK